MTTALAAYSFDAGAANDDSGNGHDGTEVGSNIAWTDGHTSGGLSASGTSVDSYVSVADDAGIRPATAVTLECWVKLNSGQSTPSIFIIGKTRASGDESYSFYASPSGNPLFGIVSGSSVSTYAIGTAGTLCDDTWHHIAGTFDGTDVLFYRDGVLETTTPVETGGSGALVYDTSPFCLAGSSSHTSDRMAGLLDDVRLYDVALDVEAINADMTTPVGASTANGHLAGELASASAASTAGSFTSSTIVTGTPASAVCAAIPGVFRMVKDGTLAGAVATTAAAATAGVFDSVSLGVLVGVPVTASSRALAGTLLGGFAPTALILTAAVGPGISASASGAGVLIPLPPVGAALAVAATGPGISDVATGAGA